MSPIAAASGVAIAGLILLGRRWWSVALAGVFSLGVIAHLLNGDAIRAAFGLSLANTAEAGVSAFLLVRVGGRVTRFNRANDVLALICCVGGVNALSACLSAAVQPGVAFGRYWLAWYSSHALGILLVAPFILVWLHPPRMTWRARWEAALFLVIWLLTSLGATQTGPVARELSIQPYMMALIAWPAIRLGRHVVTLALVLLTAIMLSSHHLTGVVPASMDVPSHILATQAFLLCIAGAGLLVGASQSQLRSTEDRIRTLGDSLPNGVLFQLLRERSGRMRFLHFGPNSESVFSIPAEDVMQDSAALFDCILEEDRAMVAAAEATSIRDLVPFVATPRLRVPDGTVRWMQVSATPRRLEDGSTLWDGIQVDVTAAKAAEQALRASQERYRLLVHNSELPVLVTDRETARILFLNESAAAFLRLPVEQLSGADAARCWVHRSDRDRCVALLESQGRVSGFEAWMRVQTGEQRCVTISANRFEFDGRPAYFVVFSDITDIKNSQVELEHERSLFRTLFSTIPDPAWLTDPHGVYVAGNRALEHYLHVGENGVVGKTVADFFPEDIAQHFRRHNDEAVLSGGPIVMREWLHLPHSNSQVFAEITRTPVRDRAGKLLGVLAIARDMTAPALAEQLLRERVALQEQLERIAASVPGALFSFRMDREGAYSLVYSSPALAAAVGAAGVVRPVAELFSLIHPEDRRMVEASIRQSASSLSAWSLDFRAHLPLRGDVWVEGRAMPLREPDGSTLWHGILINITERKRIELELAEQSVRRRILIEQSSDGIVVLDTDRRVRECNASFAGMLGYAPSEMVGLYLWDFEGAFSREQFETSAGCLAPAPIFETRYRCKDGSLLDVEVSVSTATVGDRTLSYCVIRNVSRRRAAEEALRRSEERYRLLVESGTEGIWAFDAAGTTTFANPQLAQMLGCSSAELIGRDYLEFLDFQTPESLATWKEDVRSSVLHRASIGLRHNDGHVVPVLASRRLLFDKDGVATGGLMMITDLTEHKRMEQQLHDGQKARSIALLAGGVAHDFNNLLTPVLGLASVLHRRTSGRDREMVESIIQASETAANLTRQLLAYSGRGQMVARPLQIDRHVGEFRDLLRATMSRNIQLDLALNSGDAATLADPGQIQQIVMNLAINASEAIGKAAPGTVTISTLSRSIQAGEFSDQLTGETLPPGRYVGIKVADTGCGMSETVKSRIFEPFYSTKFTGRGLGLAAVGGIIRSLHGGVSITTREGQGARFEVLLPACAPIPEAVAPAAVDPPRSRPVLLVDDDAKVVTFLTALLEAQGYRVAAAANGAQALELLESGAAVAGVMLDLGLPGTSGRRLLDALASRWPDLPVLLMSALGDDAEPGAGSGGRRLPLVPKPFNYNALLDTVREVFGAAAKPA